MDSLWTKAIGYCGEGIRHFMMGALRRHFPYEHSAALDDCCQEAIARLELRITRSQFTTEHQKATRAWVTATAVNVAREHQREKVRHKTSELQVEPTTEDHDHDDETEKYSNDPWPLLRSANIDDDVWIALHLLTYRIDLFHIHLFIDARTFANARRNIRRMRIQRNAGNHDPCYALYPEERTTPVVPPEIAPRLRIKARCIRECVRTTLVMRRLDPVQVSQECSHACLISDQMLFEMFRALNDFVMYATDPWRFIDRSRS